MSTDAQHAWFGIWPCDITEKPVLDDWPTQPMLPAGRIVPRTEDERAAMESTGVPEYFKDPKNAGLIANALGQLPSGDYEWKTLQTVVSFPLKHLQWGKDLVHQRMTQEIATFKEKMRYVMGPFWTEEDAHRGVQACSGVIRGDRYDITLRTTLKVYLPRLEEYLSELHDAKEDTEMNGTNKASQFVFEGMALQTPEQWEQVKAIPGELFKLPEVVIPARTIVAKDAAAAKKAIWAEAVKVEGVDPARLEVLVSQPFC